MTASDEQQAAVTPSGAAPAPIEPQRPDATRLDELGIDDRRLVLSDLLNRVIDKGLVITGSVTLAVADIDLVRLDLGLALTAVEAAVRRADRRPEGPRMERAPGAGRARPR